MHHYYVFLLILVAFLYFFRKGLITLWIIAAICLYLRQVPLYRQRVSSTSLIVASLKILRSCKFLPVIDPLLPTPSKSCYPRIYGTRKLTRNRIRLGVQLISFCLIDTMLIYVRRCARWRNELSYLFCTIGVTITIYLAQNVDPIVKYVPMIGNLLTFAS